MQNLSDFPSQAGANNSNIFVTFYGSEGLSVSMSRLSFESTQCGGGNFAGLLSQNPNSFQNHLLCFIRVLVSVPVVQT